MGKEREAFLRERDKKVVKNLERKIAPKLALLDGRMRIKHIRSSERLNQE